MKGWIIALIVFAALSAIVTWCLCVAASRADARMKAMREVNAREAEPGACGPQSSGA